MIENASFILQQMQYRSASCYSKILRAYRSEADFTFRKTAVSTCK